jgi:penicillin amidase
VVFANRHDIALMHAGRVPAKRAGQGRLPVGALTPTASGARGAMSTVYGAEWRGYIPLNELPFSVNPARGWLASANQEVTDEKYPWYLGSEFYPPERSQRLHRLLVNEDAATLSSAWDILLDNYSRLAARALPLLLRHLPPHDSTATDSARIANNQDAADLLRAWDYRYGAALQAPVLFDLWWTEFYRLVWLDDLNGDFETYLRPSRAVTLVLLAQDTLAEAFDDVGTQTVETAGDLARRAFTTALKQAVPPARGFNWGKKPSTKIPEWGRYRPVSIPHLLRLGPLGITGLEADGCGECINAQRGSHGPSWRMVVQTGKRPEAWGIYPGGQTGNPGSPRYDAFVKDWAAGRAYRLLFLNWPLEVPDSTGYILALKGKK